MFLRESDEMTRGASSRTERSEDGELNERLRERVHPDNESSGARIVLQSHLVTRPRYLQSKIAWIETETDERMRKRRVSRGSAGVQTRQRLVDGAHSAQLA